MALALFVLFGGIFFARYFIVQHFIKPVLNRKPLPVSVSVVKAVAQQWQPTLSVPGTLIAVNGIDVSPEVSGMVSKIYFKSGQMVKKGNLLVQLEDTADIQQLNNLKAQLHLNLTKYRRLRSVLKVQAVSKQDVDIAFSNYQQSLALVKQQKHFLGEKSIRAPFDGKLGIRQVNLGQFVSPGMGLVSLQSLNPLYVSFHISENHLPDIHVGQAIKVHAAGVNQAYSGHILAINSLIDPNTRTIEVRASISNPKYELLPGGFVQVEVLLPQQEHVVVVPQTAISFSLYGNMVYLLTPKEGGVVGVDKPVYVANEIPITIGRQNKDMVSITKGLKVGDTVVLGGQLRLQSGALVTIFSPSEQKK